LRLLARFRAGGGRLYDLESLTDESGRRVAAFGYWAGFAGAAVALRCWLAQREGQIPGPLAAYPSATVMQTLLEDALSRIGDTRPTVLIVGALGRVGSGAGDLCTALGITPTRWDMGDTASGGPFPEILDHDIFLNCILAAPGAPVFVPAEAVAPPRRLSVIGDIACDPASEFSPIKVYDRSTTWEAPALRVHDLPPLDVTAIDNLPSLLPLESSRDFAAQLLPSLLAIERLDADAWGRAAAAFDRHAAAV
jgi:saccharopine dehydrogenase (NAD+, L-lysine forming)